MSAPQMSIQMLASIAEVRAHAFSAGESKERVMGSRHGLCRRLPELDAFRLQ